ncbi:hypothetical protein SAMN05444392_101756 [Seinonella peptonophila]|uniref:Uncharacterized protein n=1 Tax=Seinonella peptonophila TaxID=112248 RepID=A0A1M4U197_9BACL|nr:hypothetical protein [Seinonella peptonophila]SHE50499.1 hypothetical protein SAMN05444392_101756 [Seinonella peptonophila]
MYYNATKKGKHRFANEGKRSRPYKWLIKRVSQSFMIVANFLVVICIIALSLNHTIKLMALAGYNDWRAYVGVYVWEVMFIFCSTHIDYAITHRKKHSGYVWSGFILGFIILIVSNYAAVADNWLGKTLGILTPAIILVMKKILYDQISKPKNNHLISDDDQSVSSNNQTCEQSIQTSVPNENDNNVKVSSTSSVEQDAQTKSFEVDQKKAKTMGVVGEAITGNLDDSIPLKSNDKHPKQINEEQKSIANDQTKPNPCHVTNSIFQRASKKILTIDKHQIKKVALEYYEEKGKLPSVKVLAYLARTSRSQAKEVKKELEV